MIQVDTNITPADLLDAIERFWRLSADKIRRIERDIPPDGPAVVFTRQGRYTSRGWTDWTRGFRFGSALIQYDATGEEEFLNVGRDATLRYLQPQLTHTGVHDHGFNILSTFGQLWRMQREGRLAASDDFRRLCEMALRVSGAVQAARWTPLSGDGGFIHSFNGPHSLFVDTLRSGRSLALAHLLGQVLLGEGERQHSLLERCIQHARATAQYNVYYGEGRDRYDEPGRVAHEVLFNPRTGEYRAPATQQGYSPWSTWTRGLAWAILGFAELLEYLDALDDGELQPLGGRGALELMLAKAARVTCEFYLQQTPTDGVPYWDTGAPGLAELGDYLDRPADPFNDREPVDSSAAAIACQGLMRFGRRLISRGEEDPGGRFFRAGLATLSTLLEPPYLSEADDHDGLLLHAIYHRPRGWDYIPPGRSVPCGESCMWGDYHVREAVLYVRRLARDETEYRFFGPTEADA